jgi:hypothetical protein
MVSLTGLIPLAHASPPDPTWVPGIYDDRDHDDVVLLITSTSIDLNRGPGELGEPSLVVVAFVSRSIQVLLPLAIHTGIHLRSPPA